MYDYNFDQKRDLFKKASRIAFNPFNELNIKHVLWDYKRGHKPDNMLANISTNISLPTLANMLVRFALGTNILAKEKCWPINW